jgi:hypothetical protein
VTTTSDDISPCDIDTSPTVLLASLFAARRSGDPVLVRFFQRRLTELGIRVMFTPDELADVDPTVRAAADREGGAR